VADKGAHWARTQAPLQRGAASRPVKKVKTFFGETLLFPGKMPTFSGKFQPIFVGKNLVPKSHLCLLTSTSAEKYYGDWCELCGLLKTIACCTNICNIMCENPGRHGRRLCLPL